MAGGNVLAAVAIRLGRCLGAGSMEIVSQNLRCNTKGRHMKVTWKQLLPLLSCNGRKLFQGTRIHEGSG